jgi:hypothetical protein
MIKPIIHIGYPKAGSTWLQDRVFNNSELQYYCASREFVYRYILEPDCFSFDSELAKRKVEELFRNPLSRNLTPIVSSELLCGSANINGGANARIYADRLKKILPEAKIIIVIREQLSWLESFYKMEVCHNKKFYHPEALLATRNDLDKTSKFLIYFLFYDKLIECYQTLFGKGNVLVLPFETLCSEPFEFIRRVLLFSHVHCSSDNSVTVERVNPGMSIEFTRVRRLANAVSQFYLGGGLEIPDNICRLISFAMKKNSDGFYDNFRLKYPQLVSEISESNSNSERLSGINLRNLGYFHS